MAELGVLLSGQCGVASPILEFASKMSISDPSETVEAVHRLKQEIDRLTEEQSKALKEAIYVGMTPDEAKEYDQRRTRITQLVQQLGMLEKAQ